MHFKVPFKSLNKVAAAFGVLATYYLCHDEKKVWLFQSSGYLPSTQWDWNWDKREHSSSTKPPKRSKNKSPENGSDEESTAKHANSKPVATRYLIFIRHGQYNLEGEHDNERYLTEKGRDQARLTGRRLKELAWNYSRFVHSTMTRATETANLILEELDFMAPESIEQCNFLREGAPIPPEPPIGSWKAESHFFIDGARIEAAFRKYCHRAPKDQIEDSYEIFVCHANVIRYFVCRALQLPPEAWLRMSLHNGSITCFAIRPDGRVSLKMLGDCGFMPQDKLTFN